MADPVRGGGLWGCNLLISKNKKVFKPSKTGDKKNKERKCFFTYAFLSFLCLKQVCKVNKHAIFRRFLLIPLFFYEICGSAPGYTIRALKNILASHMTWMFPCKI